MEQTLFTVEGYDYQFRLAKMNALDVLAFRTQVSFDSMENARALFAKVIENIEIQVGQQWFPCKEKDREIYYPAELDTNIDLLNKLVGYFLNDFLKPVFRKSNESKN
jgi:hypothetical protein